MKSRRLFFVIGIVVILLICLGVIQKTGQEIQITDADSLAEVSLKPTLKPLPISSSTPKLQSAPVPTLIPDSIYTPAPRAKGDIPERSYESHREFPYENMEYADETTYARIKEAYENMEYDVQFKKGDVNSDEKYLEAYKKLVDLDITFSYEGEEFFLSEYGEMKVRKNEVFSPDEFAYYYFDMDGDGKSELCIRKFGTYIFKYDEATDEIKLWHEFGSPWQNIYGTRLLHWDWEGVRHTLCKLDENAEVESGVLFLVEATWSNGRETYLVTLPVYADESKQFDITMDMKKQAYYSEEEGLYYFNVTQEQYDELTKRYFKGCELAEEELKKVTYPYEELFGESQR